MKHQLLVVVGLVAACGGGDEGNPAADGGDMADASGSGDGVAAVAHVLHGAEVTTSSVARASGVASDGDWYVTPDEAKLTIERIGFAGVAGGAGAGADLVDCELEFAKATPSLASLLDCPFTIEPGTYGGMTVHVAGTFEILIDDAINGIYTDPESATLLADTAPAGGPAFVEYTRPLGATGVEVTFPTPLVVEEGDTVSLAVVLDAIQTLPITISDGGSTLEFKDPDQIPVNIFPSLDAPGLARYFTSADTAESYNDSLVLANIVRVYEAADGGQPVYLMTQQTAGPIGSMCSTPAPAYPVDPATSTPNDAGAKLGGWLGRDDTDTTCWAVPDDIAYETYRAYFTMSAATDIGDDATISCEATDAPTPPTSGDTYASGCPALTPDATASVTLVAQ